MLPTSSPYDQIDSRPAHAIVLSKPASRSARSSDFQNLFCRQFAHPVSFANYIASMSCAITHVADVGFPFEVARIAAQWIAAVMCRHVAGRWHGSMRAFANQ